MSDHMGSMRRCSSSSEIRRAVLALKGLSLLIALLCIGVPNVAGGQTQQQIDMVNVYAAYLPMEVGMEMVAAKFPSLADRATQAKTDIQATFAKTLAYIDKAISTGLPDGARKWPDLKRTKRRQMLQLLTAPSDIESATRVIQTVEQACAGTFLPTLRAALATLPLSAHPTKCGCDKCSVQPLSADNMNRKNQ